MRKRKPLCQRNIQKLDKLLQTFECPYCQLAHVGVPEVQEPHDLDPYWHYNHQCACGTWCIFAFVRMRWVYMLIRPFDVKGVRWLMTYRSANDTTSFGPQNRAPFDDIELQGFVKPERFTNLLAFT